MAIQAQMYSGFGLGDYLMDNACGLNNSMCYAPHQQKLQQEQQLMQRVPRSTDDQISSAFSQTVAAHVENQRIEIDMFINSQNERLRMALQEQRKQHMSMFVKKCESKVQFLIRQKDEEIEKAARRTAELQDYLKRMEIEKHAWQRAAMDGEAAAASLSSAIERLREAAAVDGCGGGDAAGDAESCCCMGGDEKLARNENLVGNLRKMICKRCHVKKSCVIMLPCRHLCACRECEGFLDSCPVCNVVKRASIEALI
ncbi:SBP (S-ribonuclease binding protein) family protein [Striga hermonthica]|uniref:SBP (S-ribonuclease binding protein) family protein n=1 Tax=Striga hermonthica TaxID=68872 RepID=A0A9N7MJ14_STRHE|nr:SBP (S-ribonuclease binding protein) family protein [Striga hermonthica]